MKIPLKINLYPYPVLYTLYCLYCWHPDDDAEHTVFIRPHWAPHRECLESVIGHRIRQEDVQEFLCGLGNPPDSTAAGRPQLKDHCRAFIDIADAIIGKKENDERIRQQYWAAVGDPGGQPLRADPQVQLTFNI